MRASEAHVASFSRLRWDQFGAASHRQAAPVGLTCDACTSCELEKSPMNGQNMEFMLAGLLHRTGFHLQYLSCECLLTRCYETYGSLMLIDWSGFFMWPRKVGRQGARRAHSLARKFAFAPAAMGANKVAGCPAKRDCLFR